MLFRSHGYNVAVDDAGPAVPKLSPLLELPFTAIKFDKVLVSHVHEDEAIADFIANVTTVAHARGMTTIAEGVETVEVWRKIADLGVDAVQGFLVARPLPLSAMPVWLDTWKTAPSFG